jgi:hypothetical protein
MGRATCIDWGKSTHFQATDLRGLPAVAPAQDRSPPFPKVERAAGHGGRADSSAAPAAPGRARPPRPPGTSDQRGCRLPAAPTQQRGGSGRSAEQAGLIRAGCRLGGRPGHPRQARFPRFTVPCPVGSGLDGGTHPAGRRLHGAGSPGHRTHALAAEPRPSCDDHSVRHRRLPEQHEPENGPAPPRVPCSISQTGWWPKMKYRTTTDINTA